MKHKLQFILFFTLSSIAILGQGKFTSQKDSALIYLSDRFKVLQVSDSVNLVTEIVVQQYETNQYVNSYRYLYTYNGNGQETEYLSQYWDNPSWVDSYRTKYSYNSSGNITLYTFEYYNMGWQNSSKIEYSYDFTQNLIQTMDYYWTNSAWQPTYKSIFTYDGQSRIVEQVASSYSYWLNPPVWTYTHRLTYHYNNQTDLPDSDYVYNHNGTDWEPSSRTSYTYTPSGMDRTSYTENHNTHWIPAACDSSAYDNNDNRVYNIYKQHNGTSWEDYELTESTFQNNLLTERIETSWMYNPYQMWKYRSEYTYNGTNRIGELNQTWENNQWVNQQQWLMTYDQNNFIAIMEMMNWNGTDWDPFYKYLYTYNTIVDVPREELIKDFVLYQNYPNPFNSSTKIIYALPAPTEIKLVLYNAIGKKVKILDEGLKLPGNHEVLFDDNSLSSGVYFYEIQTPTRTESKKMILLK